MQLTEAHVGAVYPEAEDEVVGVAEASEARVDAVRPEAEVVGIAEASELSAKGQSKADMWRLLSKSQLICE